MRWANDAIRRWTMKTTRAPTRRHRPVRTISTLQLVATTFVMHAMVGPRSRQLKMPRPDA